MIIIKILIDKIQYKFKPDGETESPKVNARFTRKLKYYDPNKCFNTSFKKLAQALKQGESFIQAVTKDSIELLVLDIDDGYNSTEEVLNVFNKIGKPNIIYPSFSYNPAEGKYKFRAIYRMDKLYKLEELKYIVQMLKDTGCNIDGCTKNWKQPIYGTNKEVFYSGEEIGFNPKEYREVHNWKPIQVKEVKREVFKSNVGGSKNDRINGFLKSIANKELDYDGGLVLYSALKKYDLVDSYEWNLYSPNKGDSTERYLKKYESSCDVNFVSSYSEILDDIYK